MVSSRMVAAWVVLCLLAPATAEARGGGSSPGPFGQRGSGGGVSRGAAPSRSSFGGSPGVSSRGSAPGISRGGSSSFGRSSGGGSFGAGPGTSPGRTSSRSPSSFGGGRSAGAGPSVPGPSSRSSAPSSRWSSSGGGSSRDGTFGTARDAAPSRWSSSSGDSFRRQGVPAGGQRSSSTSGLPSFRSSPRAPSGTSPSRSGNLRGGAFGSGEAARSAGAPLTRGATSRDGSVNGGFRGRDGASTAGAAGNRPGTFGTAPGGRGSATGGGGAADRGAAPGFQGRGATPDAGGLRNTPRGGDGTFGTRPDANSTWNNGYRVGYQDGWNDRGANHAKYGHGGDGHCGYHGYYDDHHWYLSFSFGAGYGPYVGVGYYWPYHSWTLGVDYAFFYPAPVTYAYAPYGFYSSYEPIYVTRYETVRETIPVYVYETRVVYTEEEIAARAAAGEAGPAAPPAEGSEIKVADPKPAAGSPATEKLLREASDLFREKKYYDAAVKFRLAAISSPDLPGPLFALGQSLIALGQDEYAAKVLRKAVAAHSFLLRETADIAGVYADQGEFDRVMAELEARAADAPADGDARFLLGYQRYFSGDPRCRADFDGLLKAAPADGAVKLLREAVETRFKAEAELPEIK